MKKILIMIVGVAFIAFGFTPGAFAQLGKSMSDNEIGPDEYYGSDEGVHEELDTREYSGTDERINEDFKADRDLDTREYYGPDGDIDKGFDADRDLDTRGGVDLDPGLKGEESMDNL